MNNAMEGKILTRGILIDLLNIATYLFLALSSESAIVHIFWTAAIIMCSFSLISELRSGKISITINIVWTKFKKYISIALLAFALFFMIITHQTMNLYSCLAMCCIALSSQLECDIIEIQKEVE